MKKSKQSMPKGIMDKKHPQPQSKLEHGSQSQLPIDSLRNFLNNFAPIPETDWKEMALQIEEVQVAKGKVLVKIGDVDHKMFFVYRGLLKNFYVDQDGQEAAKSFIWEGGLAAPFVAMIQGLPSNMNIVALEESNLLVVKYKLIEKLFKRNPCWLEIRYKMAEKLLIERETREYQMLLWSAKKRYQSFLKSYHFLQNRLPQYEIASYLGITPVALSQIRRDLSKK